jgi:Zn-dependent peptidase ImmA (M78 family)
MARLSPEQAARELLARFARAHRVDAADVRAGLSLPLLLEFLAVEQRDVPQIVYDGREYVGELDAAQRVMLVSEAFPKMRIFTIAHEIGHHELHPKMVSYRDPPAYVLGPQPGRPDERDANLFATALLMPEQGVSAAYFARLDGPFIRHALTEEHVHWLRLGHGRNISREKIETGSLRRLAWLVATCGSANHEPLYRDFGVSKEAMTIRLEELELVRDGTPQRRVLEPVWAANSLAIVAPPKSQVLPPQPAAASSEQRAVALIGEFPWHSRNRILLKRHGWRAIDDDSADAVTKLRVDPPCGVVVHTSFWKRLTPEQRKDAFRKLVELSSYIFVRVGLSDASELAGTAFIELPAALLEERTIGAFRQTDGDLDEEDLFALKRVFDFREKGGKALLQADATAADANLLRLIAAERFVPAEEQQHVVAAAKRLRSGKSGARGYVLSSDRDTEPLFVKVGEHRALAAELDRGRKFQRYVSDVAIAELRFHGPSAALVQPLISANGNSPEPAPSLHEFLSDLTADRVKLFLDSILPRILTVLKGAAGRRTNDEPSRHLVANLSCYRSYIREGLTWMPSSISPASIDALGKRALQTLSAHKVAAIVHGDGHLRNFLLRNGVEPVLVDFANAGSGHPLLDFVRLEVGIWTVLLKQAEPRVAEALVRELLTRETIGPGTGLAFKGNGQGIDTALQSSLKIRDASRAVADGDDSWFEQYRAMHTLLALLALRRPEDHYLSFAVFAAVPPAVNRS